MKITWSIMISSLAVALAFGGSARAQSALVTSQPEVAPVPIAPPSAGVPIAPPSAGVPIAPPSAGAPIAPPSAGVPIAPNVPRPIRIRHHPRCRPGTILFSNLRCQRRVVPLPRLAVQRGLRLFRHHHRVSGLGRLRPLGGHRAIVRVAR